MEPKSGTTFIEFYPKVFFYPEYYVLHKHLFKHDAMTSEFTPVSTH